MPACESNEEVNMRSERMNLKCRRREKHFSPSYTRSGEGGQAANPQLFSGKTSCPWTISETTTIFMKKTDHFHTLSFRHQKLSQNSSPPAKVEFNMNLNISFLASPVQLASSSAHWWDGFGGSHLPLSFSAEQNGSRYISLLRVNNEL